LYYENYYYVINGYKDIFISSTLPSEAYRPGTTFKEILALYTFDRKLREMLLPELLRIEHTIKSSIIYAFSQAHGYKHTSYLRTESFNCSGYTNFKRTNSLIFDLLKTIDKYKYKHSAIKHYMEKYGYVPLWVLSKVMTFGKINSFYACMLKEEKEAVARSFGLSANVFQSLIYLLADFRNICAHGERVYCYAKDKDKEKRIYVIPQLPYHNMLSIPKSNKGYKYGTHDVLALLIAMKYFLQPDRYSKLIRQINYALHQKLQHRLHSVSISAVENLMGLNGTWIDLGTMSKQ
jgi:abortive infection bacteriophage resistance protein